MMRAHGVANASGGTARGGHEQMKQSFWLDDQAFIVFGRQVETPVVRSGTVMLLLDHRQSPAVEKRPAGSFTSEQQWIKRYCELKGNLLLYAPHSDAAFEGAFLLEDFVFKMLSPSRALIAGVRDRLAAASNFTLQRFRSPLHELLLSACSSKSV